MQAASGENHKVQDSREPTPCHWQRSQGYQEESFFEEDEEEVPGEHDDDEVDRAIL